MRFADPAVIRDLFFQPDSDLLAAFPDVRGRMDASERLKLIQDPTGRRFYVGPGGRELTPAEVDMIMRAGVRGA